MSPWKSRWSRVRFVKTATSKRQPVDAVERERVGGDLDRRRGHAVGDELGEELLDQRGLRRRAAGRELARRGVRYTDRPEKPGLPVVALEHRLEQHRRGRLAVGAGHAGQDEPLRRIAVERAAGAPARAARTATRIQGAPSSGRAPARSETIADGAARERLGDVLEAVGLDAGDGHEEIARAATCRESLRRA